MYPKTRSGRQPRMLMLIAGLIAISTALFALGVIIERGAHANENPAVHQEVGSAGSAGSGTTGGTAGGEAAEGAGGAKTPEITVTPVIPATGESGESAGTLQGEVAQPTAAGVSSAIAAVQQPAEPVAASQSAESHSEIVLGIDIENLWIVSAITIGWLLLLAGLFLFGRVALGVIAAAAVAATIFDIAEVVHQINLSNGLVAFIALLVAAGHVAIAILAVLALIGGNKRAAIQAV